MMYHGMVGEMTKLLSCSYEKGQLLIRTPAFHDALHRVGNPGTLLLRNKNSTLPRCFASGGNPGTLLLRNKNLTLPRCFASGGNLRTLLLRNNNPTLPRYFTPGEFPGTLLFHNIKK